MNPRYWINKQLFRNNGQLRHKLRDISNIALRISEDVGRLASIAVIAMSLFTTSCVFLLSLDHHYRIFTDSFQTVLVNISIQSALLFSKLILLTISMYVINFIINTIHRWVTYGKKFAL